VVAALGLVVALGAAAVVVMLQRSGGKRGSGYVPMAIEGVTITGHTRFGPLMIETDGTLEPGEIEAAYRAGLAQLREAAAATKPFKGFPTAVEIRDPAVDVIVPVPQLALCAPTAYPMGVPPLDCRETLATLAIGSRGEKRLMIVNERANLAAALAVGVGKAVCEFPAEDNHPRHTEICEVTKHFIESR
jgi:hypothetical protein